MNTVQDKFRGCMIGGAIGDALGYPVEFMSRKAIMREFGQNGIRDLVLDGRTNTALISDDTQMTLFTVSGLLWAGHQTGGRYIADGIYPSYIRWLHTQGYDAVNTDWMNPQPFEAEDRPRIMEVKELYSCRAPGNTCLSALTSGHCGSMEDPLNHSKGCGGVMRVAPIGLLLYENAELAFRVGAEAAAITHGHPTGYLASGLFSAMIAKILQGQTLREATEESLHYLKQYDGAGETEACIRLALKLADADILPETAVEQIGEGWVAEEALAVALYCALKESDPEKALCMAVNHDGDSDSTGAICGNLLGACYGEDAFPEKWRRNVELEGFVLDMADRLYSASILHHSGGLHKLWDSLERDRIGLPGETGRGLTGHRCTKSRRPSCCAASFV